MTEFLKRLFNMQSKTSDRVEAAGERIASAAETMATDWEAAAALNRERLGIDAPEPAVPALPAPARVNGEANGHGPAPAKGKRQRV